MSGQIHRDRAEHRDADIDNIEHIDTKPQETAAELSADTEELLAEIDELLESLPQDLASTFVQANGQ